MDRACSTHEKKFDAYRLLVGKPEVKRPLGRHRYKWEENIKMNLRKIEWATMDSIRLSQERGRGGALVSMVMNLLVQ
jgi:hypothetical protein